MSGDSGEEKNLPPSQKKLRDARRKGQIPKSRDLVSALGLVAASGYLMAQADALTDGLRQALIFAERVLNDPLEVAAPQVGGSLVEVCLRTILPFLILIPVAGVFASVVATSGLVFSLDPLVPKLENFNPISGLTRMFGVKSLVELAKSIVKAALLGATLLMVLLGTWNMLVRLPTCGMNCLGFVVGVQTKLLLSVGIGAFLGAGLGDVLIQRWLFMRDMKMSASELKREFKEQEGDPHVRGAHQRERQEAAHLPRIGLKRATILLRGRGVAVGLRYVAGEGAPIIVCRAKGKPAEIMADAAAELGIPRATAHELAAALGRKVPPGSRLPSLYFDGVARVLFAAGLA